MSLKLSVAFLAAAAVAGGVATSIIDGRSKAPVLLGRDDQTGSISSRSDRLALSDRNPTPEKIAEQIRQAQLAPTESPETSPPAELLSQAPSTASEGEDNPVYQPAQAAEPVVDESALRYFAARGDKARLEAEIARLRTLYPNWTPPADPLAVPESRDKELEAVWQLYAEGHYAEVRKAIADRQMREKGWQPPADLLDRLQVAEARIRLVNASDVKQYATVISIGAATPSLLNCGDVDVLWRVAEAFIKTNRPQRGVDAYGYILNNCTNPQERVATIQKAAALLPYESVQPLLAFEQADQSGGREFDAIRDDLARRFIAEVNEKPELEIAPEYLERVRAIADREQQPSDTLLLGWYYLRRNNMTEAEKWFRASRSEENSASASQGLALTLIARNAPAEAEETMYEWREESEEATATYLAATANLLAGDPPPTVAEPVLQRVAAFVLQKRYVPTAQQFGWYARTMNQPQTAVRWFETALQWKPDDEPSAYGLVITRQQLNDRAGVEEIRRAWAGRSERIANLGLLTTNVRTAAPVPVSPDIRPEPIQPRTVTVTETRQSPRIAERSPVQTRTPRRPAGCSATDAIALSPDQSLQQGWCLMDINRPLEAATAFETALQSRTRSIREDAAYGQSLAYLRLGLTNKAAVAAAKAPQNSKRAVELQLSILANRAIAAFDAGRYRETLLYLDQRAQLAPETVDLMVLRGYSYMNTGRLHEARRLFEAAAATGNSDASRGFADVDAVMKNLAPG